jgi:hypothetical protein
VAFLLVLDCISDSIVINLFVFNSVVYPFISPISCDSINKCNFSLLFFLYLLICYLIMLFYFVNCVMYLMIIQLFSHNCLLYYSHNKYYFSIIHFSLFIIFYAVNYIISCFFYFFIDTSKERRKIKTTLITIYILYSSIIIN